MEQPQPTGWLESQGRGEDLATRTARLAVAAAQLGVWEWDLESGLVTWDTRLEQIYGLPPGGFDGLYETYQGLIHSQDRELVNEAIQEALATRSGHHTEHRIVRPDDAIRWIEGWGSVLLDDAGAVTGMVGVARDITDRYETREQLVQAREVVAADAQRLERLQALTSALSRAASREEVASALVQQAINATDALAASVSIITEDGESLNILASVGYEFTSQEGWDRWPITVDHPLGEAARSGEPQWKEERATLLKEHPAMASTSGVERFGAFAALPLRSAGRIIGAIGLSFEHDRVFPHAEREHLLTMTEQVAIALERARLYEEAERATRAAYRANERLRFLGNATQLLASSLDYDETVSTLARLCVPEFADWAAVDLLEPDGQIRQLVAVHEDPARLEYAKEIRRLYPLNLDQPTGIARVIRTGESEFYAEISEEKLRQAPELQQEVARNIQLSSVMLVPLEVRGSILGAMTLLYGESGRHYEEPDLRMAESLGRRAAIAIDNARAYQDRDHMARTLQRSLLPPALVEIPGATLAARYEPFGDGHEVGGDFYDAFAAADDGWGLLIGDVCGKGAEAAAVMGIARFTIRALALREPSPSALLQGLNEALLRHPTAGRFCTASYAWVQRTAKGFKVTVSVAGHPPLLVVRSSGSIEEITSSGTLLGVFSAIELADTQVELEAGDALILHTDGLIGRTDVGGGELVPGSARSGVTAGAMADILVAGAVEREGGRLPDDIAVLVMKVEP